MTLTGSLRFDGEGKRVKKITDQETTIFVYSAGKLIAEYSTAPPPQEPTTKWTVTDQLGSPRVLVDSLGQVVSRRDFMPFGEEIFPDGTHRKIADKYTFGDDVRQKFTGYQKDEETGLDFAEARMYQNLHGRFTAVDPLLASGKSANPQTFNRYVYVVNNPLEEKTVKINIAALVFWVVILVLSVNAQNNDNQKTEKNAKKSELIVLAEVECIGQDAGFWSGLFPAFQYVQYKVSKVLKGKFAGERISVNHIVSKGSRSADEKIPKLSSELFAKGNKLVLFLVVNDGKNDVNSPPENNCSKGKIADYLVFDANFGAIQISENILEVIQRSTSKNKSK